MYKIYTMLALVVCYVAKMCILSASLADSLALMVLCASLIALKYLNNKKISSLDVDFKEEIKREVSAIKDNVNTIKIARGFSNGR